MTMPKVLPCSKEEMIETARKILLDKGYDACTIREVASVCGVSVGTIYTYFSSKDVLVVHAIAAEWFQLLDETKRKSRAWRTAEDGIAQFYADMRQFAFKYKAFFLHPPAKEKDSKDYYKGFHILAEQIEDIMSLLLIPNGKENDKALSAFLSNVMIAYVRKAVTDLEDTGYEQFRPFIEKLLSES